MFGLLSYAFGSIATLLVTASVTTATLMRLHTTRNYTELKLRI